MAGLRIETKSGLPLEFKYKPMVDLLHGADDRHVPGGDQAKALVLVAGLVDDLHEHMLRHDPKPRVAVEVQRHAREDAMVWRRLVDAHVVAL